ncbi:SulP family inorganic anion transporter [Piscinibacter sakaiensis]|uniref:Sulfate permease n=1 Tax=Piscinibacter sakaiensis TaxID=1547922 RepID=A0A0K8NZI9_PISS1|nr:SulP family inorganic anion transporter [Piscinibacter sakaiensis]GAP35801.1 sulfate permease [Piscinibacter sakaiensis]
MSGLREALPPTLRPLWPAVHRWPALGRETLKRDAIAGLTGGLVLVPQGVAFATIAGMPPEYGLYAAMLPAIVAALWGSSWHLVSGPTTAISIVVFATIGPLAEAGSAEYVALVLTLTLLVGLIQLALGLFRLGTLVNFVSHTVVVGFTSGAAVLIAASQVRNFFGIDIERGASVWRVLAALGSQLAQVNPWVTGTALATVAASLACRRWLPRVPHMIVGMVAGSLVAAALNALAGGAEATGIRSIGALKIGLPPLSRPDLSLQTLERLLPIAMAVALLALTEAVSISRAIALRTHQRIDGNQEFVGQGLSNIVGAFFSGYASSGSFNRSGLNYEAGARTPLAAILSAVCLLVILLFLAPLAVYLPIPAMAGILFVVAWGLFDLKHMREIVRANRTEAAILAATLAATLTLNLEVAIGVGVGLSLLVYLARTAHPPLLALRPGDDGWPHWFRTEPAPPGREPLTVLRLNGSIYFGAVNHLAEAMQAIDEADPQRRHLLLLTGAVNFVDYAGAHMLAAEARRRRALGGSLQLHHVKPEVMETLRRTGVDAVLGAEALHPAGADAVAVIRARLDAPQETVR